MKIYISGPITGTSDYQERFEAAEQIINANGGGDIVAVNPVKETAGIPEGSPWETYMRACMKILADCDAIYICLKAGPAAGEQGLNILWQWSLGYGR
jgi:nucleoside 2-deoxyribosyltransferase